MENNENGLPIIDECNQGCQPVEVPSRDEQVALNAMRIIKERVRDIKKSLTEIPSTQKDADESMALEKELERLKLEWREWEEKRDKATRERMILLGHEEAS